MTSDPGAAARPGENNPGAGVVLAVALLLLFALTQIIGSVCAYGVLSVLGFVEADGLDDLASFDFVQLALVTELIVIGVFAVVASMMGLLRAMTDLAGTRQALVQLSPLLLLICGSQLAAGLAVEGYVVHPTLDATEAVVIVALALLIGVAEELVFRGVMFAALRRRAGAVFTVVAGAGLFGLAHALDNLVNAIAVTLAVAVPFLLVRLRGGSIAGLALAHGLIDIVALLALGSLDLPKRTPTDEAAAQLIMATLICAAYVFWYWRTVRPTRARTPAP